MLISSQRLFKIPHCFVPRFFRNIFQVFARQSIRATLLRFRSNSTRDRQKLDRPGELTRDRHIARRTGRASQRTGSDISVDPI
jgi:hypothetical protein